MDFNEHYNLKDKHAFLSPSSYHWVNYTDDRLVARYETSLAVQKGIELHKFAHDAIRLGIRMPRNSKTLNAYVNDAVGYRMSPETVLYYSPVCFGTADAISFNKRLLRIHDLKTGVVKASELQLFVYAALFCLEYKENPRDISVECRIYQNDEVAVYIPEPDIVEDIMSKIIRFSNILLSIGE